MTRHTLAARRAAAAAADLRAAADDLAAAMDSSSTTVAVRQHLDRVLRIAALTYAFERLSAEPEHAAAALELRRIAMEDP